MGGARNSCSGHDIADIYCKSIRVISGDILCVSRWVVNTAHCKTGGVDILWYLLELDLAQECCAVFFTDSSLYIF